MRIQNGMTVNLDRGHCDTQTAEIYLQGGGAGGAPTGGGDLGSVIF